MGYIHGDGREQGTLFPVLLDDLLPADHICRVIDAFVNSLAMSDIGFERAEAAETGRPGYDPRDLLKLYLYGYLNQIRSSRRLEAECLRNVEVMRPLGRLYPDHKSIAEFRRIQLVTQRIESKEGISDQRTERSSTRRGVISNPARIAKEKAEILLRLPKNIRDIAWKAQTRVCTGYRSMVPRGKKPTVIISEIARELAGFI